MEAFDRFRAAVAELDRTLVGTARLQPRYEEGFVQLAMGSGGGVDVSGLVALASEYSQELRFESRIDPTVLGPLLRDLEACAGVAAV